ncbi:TonB family protein, partial [Rhizobium sp. CRIBSB]|nr:TonB family protein [Rhizobium sp. CRIBSB]
PKLQVREPNIVSDVPPPPTVNITPTPKEERVEYTAPPVNIPGPPPPPAPPPPARPSVISNPQWASRPAPQFPDRAAERGIEQGRVVLSCTVQPNGRVSDCSIVSEEPAGAGFGREALSAARRATLSPRTVDGAATGARVTFPVTFRLQ